MTSVTLKAEITKQKLQIERLQAENIELKDYARKMFAKRKAIEGKEPLRLAKAECEKLTKELAKKNRQEKDDEINIKQLSLRYNQVKSEVEKHLLSNKKLQAEVDILRQTVANQTMDLEKHKKEEEKENHLILELKANLQCCSEQQFISETKQKKLTEDAKNTEQEIVNARCLIADLERKQRQLIIYNDTTTNQRNLALKNLFKAQGELFQNRKETQSLQEDVKTLNITVDGSNKQLAEANLACNCTKEKLQIVKLQLAETKKMYDNFKKSMSNMVAETRLNEVLAEKAKLEKEILHFDNVVEQLQIQLKLQNVTKVKQQKCIRDTEDECSRLNEEITTMKRQLRNFRVRKFYERSSSRPIVHCRWRNKEVQRNYWKTVLERKNAEIEDLQRRLARRPDDAILNLHQCQWDNRQLKKLLQGAQGEILMYESQYEIATKKNEELTFALRKLRCEFESKRSYLSHISTRDQPPTEDKSKDKCKSELGGKNVSWTPILPIHQSSTEDKSTDKCKRELGGKNVSWTPILPIHQSSTEDKSRDKCKRELGGKNVSWTPILPIHQSSTEDKSTDKCKRELGGKNVSWTPILPIHQSSTEDKSRDKCKRELGGKNVSWTPILPIHQSSTEDKSTDKCKRELGGKNVSWTPILPIHQSSTEDKSTDKCKRELGGKNVSWTPILPIHQSSTEDKSTDKCKRELGGKNVSLPPILPIAQSSTEEKSKDKCKSEFGAEPMRFPPVSTMARLSTEDQPVVARTPKPAHLSPTKGRSQVACRPVSRLTRFPVNAKLEHACEKESEEPPILVRPCTYHPRPPPTSSQAQSSPQPRPPPTPRPLGPH
ncbi:uncharacterized protein LOC120816542 isoform X1 [Gasterosteus aculeatus]